MMERQVEDLFQSGYHPEIDFSPELDEKVIEKHLQWSNEICCIDITIEVSMFSHNISAHHKRDIWMPFIRFSGTLSAFLNRKKKREIFNG